MSEGGDIVELAKRLRDLPTVSATLEYLEGKSGCVVRSATPHATSSKAQPSHEQPTFTLHPLKNKSLLSYLRSRQIDESIGCTYCQEIHQKQKGRWYFSVAFGNQSGGYELRNPYFKGCMGSKDLSIIAYSPGEIQEGCLVFEGFMDFLSFLTLVKRQDYLFRMESPCDYLILNSVCNQKKCTNIWSVTDTSIVSWIMMLPGKKRQNPSINYLNTGLRTNPSVMPTTKTSMTI